MKEIWRDIKGCEGKYQVSNTGMVKSLNYRRTGKERILKLDDNGHGYLYVSLSKDGKGKSYPVHKLVATAFLENPNNLPEVNHKDEDKTNNCVENLEWCSKLYNINYGTGSKRSAEKRRNDPNRSKSVIGVDRVTGLIVEFLSISEASRQLGINQGSLCSCLKGRLKSCGGFQWYYTDANNNDDAE